MNKGRFKERYDSDPEFRAEHQRKNREAMRKKYRNDPEYRKRQNERCKRWREENPEKFLESVARCRLKRLKKPRPLLYGVDTTDMKVYQAEWRKANKARLKEYNARYYANKYERERKAI